MDKFFVITNKEKDKNYETTHLIQDYLLGKGRQCVLCSERKDKMSENYNFTSPQMVPPDTECIIVLGGDGTLIQAARDLRSMNVPFIGVNFGKLGYMAEINKEKIIPTLDLLMDDQYQIENRMMITGKVMHNGQVVKENVALNDIVISRLGVRIMDFSVLVNDKLLYHYTADGMIVSTPTGSTAYNMSAGGPLVEPAAKLMVLTPICSHALNNRSIVLSCDDVISIQIGGLRNSGEEKLVGYDGYDVVKLTAGDEVRIEKCTETTKIIKISDMSFLEILKRKMGETG